MERPIQAFKTSKQASTSKKPQSHTDFHERLQKFKASKQVTRKSHKTTSILVSLFKICEASKQVTSKKPQNHTFFGETLSNIQDK